ncbi:hypothetical protein JW848_08630 [Candidatus Bipolaricaulota bacterium]|nr:hypothetical protein [Candidatus Bipolaricaulota bacterium]
MSRKPVAKQESETRPRIRRSLIGHRDPTHRLWIVGRQLAAETAAFAALAAAIVVLDGRQAALEFVAVLSVTAATLLVWHRRRDLLFFVVVAVAGTIGELVFVRFDVWRYAHPAVLGIPAWFPIAFGTAAVIGARMVATIESIGRHGGA